MAHSTLYRFSGSSSSSSMSLFILLSAYLFFSRLTCSAFVLLPQSPMRQQQQQQLYLTQNSKNNNNNNAASFWKQRPGESDTAFYRRIQQASSDPVAFEKFVLEEHQQSTPNSSSRQPKVNGTARTSAVSSKKSSQMAMTATDLSTTLDDSGESSPKKRGYQRVEEWEAEQQQKAKEVSWDERVQFDGLRNGNGFRQNEILRHHLNTF